MAGHTQCERCQHATLVQGRLYCAAAGTGASDTQACPTFHEGAPTIEWRARAKDGSVVKGPWSRLGE